MLVAVLIIALCMVGIGWYLSHDVFSPYVAVPGVWSMAILIYYFLPNTFYAVTNDFPYVLSLWLVGFFASSVIAEHYTPVASQAWREREPSPMVLRVYFVLSCFCIPAVCGAILWQALTEDPENIFRYMRIMNTGLDENIEMPNVGILIYSVSLAFVLMFFSLLYFKSKLAKFVVILLNVMLAVVTMAKTTFLSIMFSSLYLCYVQNIIKKRHLLYGLAVFVALSFVVQQLRSVDEDVEANSFLALYLSSSIVAFDHFAVPCSSQLFGMHTFRIFYAIGHAIGLTEPPADTVLAFVSVPNMTNTYTNMYPFYEDFGYVGVLVFSIVYGLFYGYLYKKSRTGGKFQLILYAIFLTFVLMEFIGEFLFTNMSATLQYIFFAFLPFAFKRSRNERLTC